MDSRGSPAFRQALQAEEKLRYPTTCLTPWRDTLKTIPYLNLIRYHEIASLIKIHLHWRIVTSKNASKGEGECTYLGTLGGTTLNCIDYIYWYNAKGARVSRKHYRCPSLPFLQWNFDSVDASLLCFYLKIENVYKYNWKIEKCKIDFRFNKWSHQTYINI